MTKKIEKNMEKINKANILAMVRMRYQRMHKENNIVQLGIYSKTHKNIQKMNYKFLPHQLIK